MLWVWLLDLVALVTTWVVSWFPDWVIPFPEGGLAVLVPIPLGITGEPFDTWVMWSLAVAGVLVVGRVLTWLYRLIPANG